MSDKKRKRHSDGVENSRKRVISDNSSGIIKITHIPKNDEWGPVLASTPGLSVPSGISLQAYRKRTKDDPRNPHSELLLHSSDHPKIDYTAREQQGGGSEGLLKHYVGVFDPEKREVQVIEARTMHLRSTLRSEDMEMRKEQPAKDATASCYSEKFHQDYMLTMHQYRTLRQELGMTFGTKKAKKVISAISDNAITPLKPRGTSPESLKRAVKKDPTAMAVLESMAISAENAPTRQSMQAAIDDAKLGPTHNPDAKIPAEIYPLSSIVGDNVMKECKVKPWVVAIEAGEEIQIAYRFIAHRLKAMVKEDDIVKLKVMKYMLMLMEFLFMLKSVKEGGRKLPGRDILKTKLNISDALLDIIKRRFTDGNEMTKWHVDNLITHLALLSLIVDKFETDTFDLREDLGLKPVEMRKYFQQVGAKFSAPTERERAKMRISRPEGSTHHIARLTLPLQFPKQRKYFNIRRK